MRSIQLDVSFGSTETVQDAIREMTEDTEITGRVVIEHGPGGGWPVVEFTGPDDEITRLEANYEFAVQ